jgi:hypothetical protein
MPVRSPSVRLRASVAAGALLAGAWLASHPGDGDDRRACVGSLGTVVCVPPEEPPPAPPSEPNPPPLPSS